MPYDPKTIEPRWQNYWLENETFRAELDPSKQKYYVLDMFPYPSGDGLHVGHPEGYTATDILARYKRMRGFNVLHPMGWDAFGLPAEQYAIKTGTHPRETTQKNINNFKRQIRSLGFSYDWSREIDTTDPKYYRWTQWIFQQLYERGLAYEAEVAVNWCPALGTVLANEEVIDGKSERGDHPIERLPMRQWMLAITKYADRLIEDLDELDWPEPIKKMQRDWIGRSEGAHVRFPVEAPFAEAGTRVEVFTTRPDTLFGATYMVLAPEHPLVESITTDAQREAVTSYVTEAGRKSERARMAETKQKTGVPTGATATNPVNGESIPIWVADYVLATYGTGAIMAVPGHDERDFEFATAFDLPIVKVVDAVTKKGKARDDTELPFSGDGIAVNSGLLDGLGTPEAKAKIIERLEAEDTGAGAITYKLRDWLFSRQRYWGEPFPIVHKSDGSIELVPESELPLTLPDLDDFTPSGQNDTPLERVTDWIELSDPSTGETIRRDRNTMPQWAGSCWYYLRFCDPHNNDELISQEAEQYWMPVDLYVGGAEHAVLHLLYARFWHKVLYDLGVVHTREPFGKLVNQGMILGYSYRYFDDNVADDPSAAVRVYSYKQVEADGERFVASEDGVEVKSRWVPLAEVKKAADGSAFHPTLEEVALEEVVEKMSKSRGNVVNPDDVVDMFGADSMRLYEMFIGPLEKDAPWSTDGISGVRRFLERAHKLVLDDNDQLRELANGDGSEEQQRLLAQTIFGVTQDFENMRFNTAISKLMVLARDVSKSGNGALPHSAAETMTLLLAPLAPHLAEELWSKLGHEKSLAHEPWPVANEALLETDTIRLMIQVNGKKRDEIEVAADADDATIQATALASEGAIKNLGGREPKKVIVVPGRLVNIVG
ncbi:MAG: leucine--tRNA ligase [Myxococcota bacterium]|nr:leucine--tRNA ligase [Myxococcota bacterium]